MINNENEDTLLTPREWQMLLGVRILDPDGWREPGAPDFSTPITEDEFRERLSISTASFTREFWEKL